MRAAERGGLDVLDRILNEYGDKYEAFIVMDADNIIAPDYLKIMNQAFDAGYLVCTSYRNSKNFDIQPEPEMAQLVPTIMRALLR